MNWLERSDL